ncbi:MAG TPA: pitrilysin family protein [Polyangiaceae bacterium]|nr:pitrilysin family protein [Polyangiaceae bacterium]
MRVEKLSELAIERRTLSSTLRLCCVPMPSTHRVVTSLHVRLGSRFEPAPLGGISHFLEHMLHRGTESQPSAHELALAFESLGSELGAATYVDHTVLSASSPPENLPAVLKLLGEVVRVPVFKDLTIERGIVREEILESLNDEGDPIDPDELALNAAFPDHALGRPITGTLEALERFDVPTLRQFHEQRYHADAMVLTVAGCVDADRVQQASEVAFAGLRRGELPVSDVPAPLGGPRFRYVEDTGSQTHLRVGFRAPGENDPLEPATELALRILDDGMSTRLYHQVCDERGLAYDVSAAYEAFADCGLFMLAGEAAHTSSEKLLGSFLDVVRELRDNGPSESELTKAQRRFAWQMQAMLDDPAELCAFIGLGELTGIARTPADRLAALESVSPEQVRAALGRVFCAEGLLVASVGKLNKAARRALEKTALAFA